MNRQITATMTEAVIVAVIRKPLLGSRAVIREPLVGRKGEERGEEGERGREREREEWRAMSKIE